MPVTSKSGPGPKSFHSFIHLYESGDMAHTQALSHTHIIHNNTKEGK